jgi:hypothetical protein
LVSRPSRRVAGKDRWLVIERQAVGNRDWFAAEPPYLCAFAYLQRRNHTKSAFRLGGTTGV